MIQINLSNKTAYTLITLILILVIGTGVIAYNSGLSPDVAGHSIEELEVAFNCQVISSENTGEATCPENTILTGGGGHINYASGPNNAPMTTTRPYGGDSWRCYDEGGDPCYITYAVCCKLE